jgi:hypothetical protein
VRGYRIFAKVEVPETAEAPEHWAEVQFFGGSMSEAISYRKSIMNAWKVKRETVTIEEIDIPTDKAGLLAFLNKLLDD